MNIDYTPANAHRAAVNASSVRTITSISGQDYDDLIASAYLQQATDLSQLSWLKTDAKHDPGAQLQGIADALDACPVWPGVRIHLGPAADFSVFELVDTITDCLTRNLAQLRRELNCAKTSDDDMDSLLLDELGLANPNVRINGCMYGWAVPDELGGGALVRLNDELSGVAGFDEPSLRLRVNDDARTAVLELTQVSDDRYVWHRTAYFNVEDQDEDGVGRMSGVLKVFKIGTRSLGELVADVLVSQNWCTAQSAGLVDVTQTTEGLDLSFELSDFDWSAMVRLNVQQLAAFEAQLQRLLPTVGIKRGAKLRLSDLIGN